MAPQLATPDVPVDLDRARPGVRRVLVVGGGAGGSLVGLAVLRAATRDRPVHVVLVEPGRLGRGLAYGTTDAADLLNVPAGRMSAHADRPDDFVRWSGRPAAAFLPRRVFGEYLEDELRAARSSGATWEQVRDRVVDIDGCRVRTQGGAHLTGDAVVLAAGYLPRPAVWGDLCLPGLHPDPWAVGAPPTDRSAVVIGTGLTGVDAALSLIRRGSPRVVLVSRHGWLPAPHPAAPLVGPADLPDESDVSLAALASWVRGQSECHDVRAVVDALRPMTTRLWRALPDADKHAFLARHRRWWDVHRHRVPPETWAVLTQHRRSGRIRVVRGELSGVATTADRLLLELTRRGRVRHLPAALVVDATGPGRDVRVAAERSPLWRSLLDSGTIVPDRFRLGVRTDDQGRVVSAHGSVGDLWTLGTLRGGELWETTAIPELRGQAAVLARSLVTAAP
jgi:uncharacterized NAD(P)/FAD-binding protein YdhS